MKPSDIHSNFFECRNWRYDHKTASGKESGHACKNKKKSKLITPSFILLGCNDVSRDAKTVIDGWREGSTSNNKLLEDYLLKCGIVSCFLMCWTRSHKHEEDFDNIGITGESRTLAVVGVLLIWSLHEQVVGLGHPQKPPPPAQPHRQCSEQHPPPVVHGRPLVEVLSLRANFVVVGTIAVFDGIRGQIMYKNDRGQVHAPINNPEIFIDLVLTGPYVAISADGESFAFKVNVSGSDEFDDTNGGTLWEFIVDDVDDVVESSISTDNGDILVTYAVLGNAIEASVQVYLVRFRETANTSTHVHGKISVHLPMYGDDDKVWLLSCQADERVELIPSSASSIIPLARSIVVVPVGSSLMVKVSLYATPTPTNQDSTIFLQGNLNFSFGDQTLGFHTAIGELRVCVDVTH